MSKTNKPAKHQQTPVLLSSQAGLNALSQLRAERFKTTDYESYLYRLSDLHVDGVDHINTSYHASSDIGQFFSIDDKAPYLDNFMERNIPSLRAFCLFLRSDMKEPRFLLSNGVPAGKHVDMRASKYEHVLMAHALWQKISGNPLLIELLVSIEVPIDWYLNIDGNRRKRTASGAAYGVALNVIRDALRHDHVPDLTMFFDYETRCKLGEVNNEVQAFERRAACFSLIRELLKPTIDTLQEIRDEHRQRNQRRPSKQQRQQAKTNLGNLNNMVPVVHVEPAPEFEPETTAAVPAVAQNNHSEVPLGMVKLGDGQPAGASQKEEPVVATWEEQYTADPEGVQLAKELEFLDGLQDNKSVIAGDVVISSGNSIESEMQAGHGCLVPLENKPGSMSLTQLQERILGDETLMAPIPGLITVADEPTEVKKETPTFVYDWRFSRAEMASMYAQAARIVALENAPAGSMAVSVQDSSGAVIPVVLSDEPGSESRSIADRVKELVDRGVGCDAETKGDQVNITNQLGVTVEQLADVACSSDGVSISVETTITDVNIDMPRTWDTTVKLDRETADEKPSARGMTPCAFIMDDAGFQYVDGSYSGDGTVTTTVVKDNN